MMIENATNSEFPAIARVFVDEVLDSGHRAGIDVAALLHDLGLAERDLGALQPVDFAKLWLEISHRIGDELFGLAKRPMAPGSVTLMGHAVRGAKTFDIALRRALRFLKVVLEEPYGVVEVADGLCTVRLVETGAARSAFAYRAFFLILHGLNCWLVRERIPLRDIRFPCAEPVSVNDYGDFFGKPVVFEAEAALISFDAKYLRRPVGRSEEALKRFLRTTPESFLRGYRPELGLKGRIQTECLGEDFKVWPTTDQIAQLLGLSTSTLHRRLRDTGQSIREIKEERRRSLAVQLLKTTNLPIAVVADRVGYAEPSAFHRAFGKWFSMTPGAMRRRGGLT